MSHHQQEAKLSLW